MNNYENVTFKGVKTFKVTFHIEPLVIQQPSDQVVGMLCVSIDMSKSRLS